VEDIGRLTSAAGVPVLELAAEEGTLEQAYLDLTSAETEFTGMASPPRQQEARS
jgi:ABC-2 type transport system ATP-binding protein